MKTQDLLNYLYEDQELVNEPYFITIAINIARVFDTMEKQEVIELIRFKNSFLLGHGISYERELPFLNPWFNNDYELSSTDKDLYYKTWEKTWRSIDKLESEVEKYNNIFITIDKEKDLYNHIESCSCYFLKPKKRQWVALYGIYNNDKIIEIALIIEDDPKVYERLV